MAFLVLPPLAWGSEPRGDEPHIHSAPGVDHDQNSAERVSPQRDLSLLIFRGDIPDGQGQFIFESADSVREVDPVLCEVGSGLGWIPFAAHRL
jgi:hypothetical protein